MKWLTLAGKVFLWLVALSLLVSITDQASGLERFLALAVAGVLYFQWRAERTATQRYESLVSRLDRLRPQSYDNDD